MKFATKTNMTLPTLP